MSDANGAMELPLHRNSGPQYSATSFYSMRKAMSNQNLT